jgi:hypothetical protein
VGSFRLALLEYDFLGPAGPAGPTQPRIQSSCVENPTQGGHQETYIRIPTGTGTNPIFAFSVETFDDSACAGAGHHAIYVFTGGLAAPSSPQNRFRTLLPTSAHLTPASPPLRHLVAAGYQWLILREF